MKPKAGPMEVAARRRPLKKQTANETPELQPDGGTTFSVLFDPFFSFRYIHKEIQSFLIT